MGDRSVEGPLCTAAKAGKRRGMKTALAHYPPHIRRAALIVAIGLALLIGYFSLVPPNDSPMPHLSDKVRHFAAYALLAVPVAMWLGPGRLSAVALLTAFGAAIEVAQAFAGTGRDASIWDGLADLLGAAAGAGLIWIVALTRRP